VTSGAELSLDPMDGHLHLRIDQSTIFGRAAYYAATNWVHDRKRWRVGRTMPTAVWNGMSRERRTGLINELTGTLLVSVAQSRATLLALGPVRWAPLGRGDSDRRDVMPKIDNRTQLPTDVEAVELTVFGVGVPLLESVNI
jgi:hypothetical protein